MLFGSGGEKSWKFSQGTCHTERAVVADHLMHLFAGGFWSNGVQLSVHFDLLFCWMLLSNLGQLLQDRRRISGIAPDLTTAIGRLWKTALQWSMVDLFGTKGLYRTVSCKVSHIGSFIVPETYLQSLESWHWAQNNHASCVSCAQNRQKSHDRPMTVVTVTCQGLLTVRWSRWSHRVVVLDPGSWILASSQALEHSLKYFSFSASGTWDTTGHSAERLGEMWKGKKMKKTSNDFAYTSLSAKCRVQAAFLSFLSSLAIYMAVLRFTPSWSSCRKKRTGYVRTILWWIDAALSLFKLDWQIPIAVFKRHRLWLAKHGWCANRLTPYVREQHNSLDTFLRDQLLITACELGCSGHSCYRMRALPAMPGWRASP